MHCTKKIPADLFIFTKEILNGKKLHFLCSDFGLNVISALFLIAGIHSITNLKIYEQAKNFFNSANTQSSSEESLKVIRFSVCIPFSLVSIHKH